MSTSDTMQIATAKALKVLLAARKTTIEANNTEQAAFEAWESAREEMKVLKARIPS